MADAMLAAQLLRLAAHALSTLSCSIICLCKQDVCMLSWLCAMHGVTLC